MTTIRGSYLLANSRLCARDIWLASILGLVGSSARRLVGSWWLAYLSLLPSAGTQPGVGLLMTTLTLAAFALPEVLLAVPVVAVAARRHRGELPLPYWRSATLAGAVAAAALACGHQLQQVLTGVTATAPPVAVLASEMLTALLITVPTAFTVLLLQRLLAAGARRSRRAALVAALGLAMMASSGIVTVGRSAEASPSATAAACLSGGVAGWRARRSTSRRSISTYR